MSDSSRQSPRAKLMLRIRLRYFSVDSFVQKFATNISTGGIFIRSRSPKPVGTEMTFELRLADDSPVVQGEGVVRWTQAYSRSNPNAQYGMGIEFTSLSEGSQGLIQRVVDYRVNQGLEDQTLIPERDLKDVLTETPTPEVEPPAAQDISTAQPVSDDERPDDTAPALLPAHDPAEVSDINAESPVAPKADNDDAGTAEPTIAAAPKAKRESASDEPDGELTDKLLARARQLAGVDGYRTRPRTADIDTTVDAALAALANIGRGYKANATQPIKKTIDGDLDAELEALEADITGH